MSERNPYAEQVGADIHTGGNCMAGVYHASGAYYVLGPCHGPIPDGCGDVEGDGFTPYEISGDGESFSGEWGAGFVDSYPTVAEAIAAIEQRRPALLARLFVSVLREWLSPDQWAEMRLRNATAEYRLTNCCASHDFCDANMAMAEAFEAVTGRGVLEPGHIDADLDLMNAAWALAAPDLATKAKG